MKRFTKGDLDGFFALGLDNLLMLILMSGLCLGFPLNFDPDLFYGRVLPGAAIGLLIGNLFYARQALRLAARENRNDVCALPYGINLITIFVHVFLVMWPAQQIAMSQGLEKPEADLMAWKAGIVACLGSGLIEFLGSFVVDRIRRITPRAALLAALGGIGLAFIGMDFVFRAFTYPLVGFTTLAITLIAYFGKVRFKFGLPAGLVIVVIGCAIAWATGVAPVGEARAAGICLPVPRFGALFGSLGNLWIYAPVILPMGILSLVMSLQNIESAEAAGDRYEPKPALAFNGIGSIGAALFGCPFPTTIYIGHPGWKSLGARAGYSTLNAVVLSLICFTGTLSYIVYVVPLEAGMAILIWIGVVMAAHAFQAVPKEHAPAVVMGFVPALGGFAALMLKAGLGAGGYGMPDKPFDPEIATVLAQTRNVFAEGIFALDQGFVYTSILFAATTVAIIERKFRIAAAWCLAGGFLAAIGLIHAHQYTPGDVVGRLSAGFELDESGNLMAAQGWKWTWGYLVMAGVFFVAPWVTEKSEN